MREGKKKAILLSAFLIAVVCASLLFVTIKSGKSQASNVQTTEDLLAGRTAHVIGEDEVDEEAIYQALFSTDNEIAVSIDMSDEELKKLNDDYLKYDEMGSESPIYRKADVVVAIGEDAYVIEEVGVRMKGNTSRTDFYSEEEGIYNIIHLKLNFKETFDDEEYYGEDAKQWESKEARKARKNRTFATLEKLDLKYNRTHDNTYTREYYAMQMFKDYGILSANMNLSTVTLADSDFGVMYLYETIDDKFLERNLPEEEQGGDLYKAGWVDLDEGFWGQDWHGVEYTLNTTYGVQDEEEAEFYNLDLKTNKKTSTHEALKNLLNTINNENVTEESFNSVVDTDYFGKFAAVSYFLGGPDDMRNNYNNHYVYFLPSSGKAIFIPYDYDICLGNCWDCDRADSMTNSSPYSILAECERIYQINPLYNLGIGEGGFCESAYADCLADIYASDWLTIDKFASYYDVFNAKYADKVITDEDLYYNVYDANWMKFDLNATSDSYDSYATANYTVEEFFDEIKYEYEVADVDMNVCWYSKEVHDSYAYVSVIGDPGIYTVTDMNGNEITSGTYENETSINIDMKDIPFGEEFYLTLTSGDKTEVYEYINLYFDDSEWEESDDIIELYPVYYDNSLTNWDEVYCYYWSSEGEQPVVWPGDKMISEGNSVYSCYVPSNCDFVIFTNNNGQQTGDLVTEHFFTFVPELISEYGIVTGSWEINEPAISTVYFDNSTTNWDEVYCFYWQDGVGGPVYWPGNLMYNTSDENIYEFSMDSEYDRVIFTDGNGTQTNDLYTQDGMLFSPSGVESGFLQGEWVDYDVPSDEPVVDDTPSMVYFDNEVSKWDEVYCYYWQDGVEGTLSWPGELMNSDEGTIYSYEVPAGNDCVIFNNGVDAQTTDVMILDNCVFEPLPVNYFSGTWSEDNYDDSEESTKVYFDNSIANWDKVFCHSWSSTEEGVTTAFPGNKMTKVEGNIYEIEVPEGHDGLLFTNGTDYQTFDLPVEYGKVFELFSNNKIITGTWSYGDDAVDKYNYRSDITGHTYYVNKYTVGKDVAYIVLDLTTNDIYAIDSKTVNEMYYIVDEESEELLVAKTYEGSDWKWAVTEDGILYIDENKSSEGPEEPTETETPSVTLEPEKTEAPVQTKTPVETEEPSSTDKPVNTETPNVSEKPVTPTETAKSTAAPTAPADNKNESSSNTDIKGEITPVDKDSVEIKEEYVPKVDGNGNLTVERVETEAVNTGDESPLTMIIVIGVISVIAMAVVTVVMVMNKKKNKM